MAIAIVTVVGLSGAVTINIAPDSLNVFNTTGNYITAYIEPTEYSDDFSNADLTRDNWIVLDGDWVVQDGQYVGKGGPAPADNRDISLAGVMMSAIVAPDFTMSVKVTNVAYGYWMECACIPFRYVDNNHLAMLVFFQKAGNYVIQLQISDDAHWHVLGTYPLADPNAQHEVVICAEGPSYTVMLDGALAISATFVAGVDCPLVHLGGKLGLQAYAQATASFDDFVLTEIFDVSSVDVSTVKLWRSYTDGSGDHLDLITLALSEPTSVGDYDSDGVPDVMVKFDRATVAQYLRDNGILTGEVDLVITGETTNGSDFSGGDSVKVISKGKLKL